MADGLSLRLFAVICLGWGRGGGGLKRLKSGLEPVYAIEAGEGSVEISLYSRTCTYGRFSPKHAQISISFKYSQQLHSVIDN